jgi:AcrR family transcriptional regulator
MGMHESTAENAQSLSKGEASRQRIVDAAYRLFLDQGYHGTSMRQIAERADMTMGGIYNHFDGKESIWEAVFLARHPYHTILPLILAAGGGSVAEFIRAAAGDVVAELERHNDLLNLMFIELVEFSGAHLPTMYQTILPHLLPLAERFNQLQGRLRGIPLPILARSFAGLFFSYYITERLMPAEVRPLMGESALDAFVDIYLYGILAAEGAQASAPQAKWQE